jgi:hypothetical protein
MFASELPQNASAGPEPVSHRARFLTVMEMEPTMAFIDDAKHTGQLLYASAASPLPRQIYTLAWLAASLALWAIMILVVASQF